MWCIPVSRCLNNMGRYRIMVILTITLLLLVASAPSVSARFVTPEGPNAGISPGDAVFQGERTVNFSAFSDPVKGGPVRMVRIDSGGQQTDPIALINGIANYIRGNPGQYYPVYSDGTVNQGRYCLVQDVAGSLGQVMIRTFGTDVEPVPNPSRQNPIPYRMGVQFLLPDHTLPYSEFQGPWYEYELQGNVKTSSITNVAGDTVSLAAFSADPAAWNDTFVFRFSDQSGVSRNTQVTMVFRMTLNGLNHEVPYTFTVRDYPPAIILNEMTVQRSGDLSFTVQGTPFMQYDITLPDPPAGEEYPVFSGGGWDSRFSDYHVRVHPGWNGTVRLQVHIPDTAPVTSYTIRATGPDIVQPVTATFRIDQKIMTLVFDRPEKQLYAIGDTILLSGGLTNLAASNSPSRIPIYLYVTGPNLPPNGAPLTDLSRSVEDGVPATFTVTEYNPLFGTWAYLWDTSQISCDAGTYTVHANLQPIGHRNSGYPGSPGSIDGEVPPSWDYELNMPSLHAKFDEETGGVFARGDYLYSWWYGRGSPGHTSTSSGHMKWYIFGPNFKYADYNPRFPLEDDGAYGITLPRSFTYDLSPGDYFIVYHHPGTDNQFDVLPENNLYFRGSVNGLYSTADGSLIANVGMLDGRAAVEALVRALDSSSMNDLYMMDTFTVENPVVRINPVGELVVGDELIVSGTTNLAGKGETADKTDVHDDLILTIAALDLYESGKANTAMKIPINETIPREYDPDLGARPFYYMDPIDTSSWYPGTYQITITCKEVNYKTTSTFELLREGSQRNTTADAAQNPFPSRTTAPPGSVVGAPEFTPIPIPTQTPGFTVYLVVAAIFGVFAARRR